MTYVDNFVAAVPTDNKRQFIDHANKAGAVFVELGARRILECWEDDLSDESRAGFRRATHAKYDESIVLSWMEWPDKETRDQAWAKFNESMMNDPRVSPDTNPMPYDRKHIIFGGFAPIVTLGTPNPE